MDGVTRITAEITLELYRAQHAHAPMRNAHEGWAVIHEEMDELWEEVRKREQDRTAMRKEALQVAAMAVRFLLDVCG